MTPADKLAEGRVVVAEGIFRRGWSINAYVEDGKYVGVTLSGNACEVARAYADDGHRVRVVVERAD